MWIFFVALSREQVIYFLTIIFSHKLNHLHIMKTTMYGDVYGMGVLRRSSLFFLSHF